MSTSILNDTKKVLGLASDYKAFDTDVILQINSALMNLGQLGVGPLIGFRVKDESETWEDFLGLDPHLLGGVQSYVYMKTRLGFDPPQTSHHLSALKEQILEAEWRLEHGRGAVIPNTEDYVIDGGSA